MGGTGMAGFIGVAPKVTIAPTEKAKYEMLWDIPQYRHDAPGERAAQRFLAVAKPRPGSEIIDFGCGTGRGALMLALLGNLKIHMVDFASNCLDPELKQALVTQAHCLKFTQHNLERPVPEDVRAEYGLCSDVMEHVPPATVGRVLDNILLSAQHVWFEISLEPDNFGELIGHPLHLTVRPYDWWLERFKERDCLIHHTENADDKVAIFYVSAWTAAREIADAGIINTTEQQVLEQVRQNCEDGWMHVQPHVTNDFEVMILGGAPSLNAHLDEIKRLRAEGVKLIALNGAYNWCLANGLTPSAVVVVDAREFNARFTHPVVDDCKYLIASQCHPAVLEGLPKDRTYLWHTTAPFIKPVLDEIYERWYAIPGGSTVLLRAIPLFRMLGYRRFHLFGCDSCLPDNRRHKHHAYDQPENDTEHTFSTVCGGRVFYAHGWMIAQAQEFMDLIKFLGDEIELEIYGDGLLSHILRTGAELSQE